MLVYGKKNSFFRDTKGKLKRARCFVSSRDWSLLRFVRCPSVSSILHCSAIRKNSQVLVPEDFFSLPHNSPLGLNRSLLSPQREKNPLASMVAGQKIFSLPRVVP